MDIFTQESTQIYISTLATIVSILTAVIPSEGSLTKLRKAFFSIMPFLVNVITVLLIVGDKIFSYGLLDKGMKHVLHDTDIIPFIITVVIVSFVASLVTYVIISAFKKSTYNDKQLMHFYTNLTKKQNRSGHIRIIGGSLDFFGRRPCLSVADDNLSCEHAINSRYKKFAIYRFFVRGRCKNCCLNNSQWRQMNSLIDTGCRLHIVCSNPANTATQNNTREFLGYILKTWERRDNLFIRFFTADSDPHLRGRIIEDYTNIRHVCWNFKTTNGLQNSYEPPYTFSENDRMGAFVIEAFEGIEEKGTPISKGQKSNCIDAYDHRRDDV